MKLFRFSLFSLVIFIAMVAVLLAYVERQKRLQHEEKANLNALFELYTTCKVRHLFDDRTSSKFGQWKIYDPVVRVSIHLDGIPPDENLMELLAKFSHLKSLELSFDGVCTENLFDFSRLRRIENVELWFKPNSGSLTSLAECRYLRSLSLRDIEIEDSDIEFLVDSNISELYLSKNDGVTDRALVALGKFRNLQVLDLSDTGITRSGIALLSKMKLIRLYLDGTPTTDENVKELCQSLSGLKVLWVGNTAITEKSLHYINQLPLIEEVNISWNNIPETSVKLLDAKKIDRIFFAGGKK